MIEVLKSFAVKSGLLEMFSKFGCITIGPGKKS